MLAPSDKNDELIRYRLFKDYKQYVGKLFATQIFAEMWFVNLCTLSLKTWTMDMIFVFILADKII